MLESKQSPSSCDHSPEEWSKLGQLNNVGMNKEECNPIEGLCIETTKEI